MNQQEKWIKRFGADNVFNKHCNHLTSDYECKIKMDMMYCGNKCAYATNCSSTNKVNGKGRVIGIK